MYPLIVFVIFFTISKNGVDSNQICEVAIESILFPETVTTTVFVPGRSSVFINCTETSGQNNLLQWTLQSASIPQSRVYVTALEPLYEGLGYYQSQDDGMSITLFINSTELNHTNITCTSDNLMMVSMITTLFQATLSTYDKNQITYTLVPDAMNTSSVTVSWRPPPSLGTNLAYNLTASSENTRSRSFQVSESNFTFTAPPNAPPCEVYNFSVTATPVGATYTGDGCSVASDVLRLALPSLPNITVLETSLNYTLQRHSAAFLLMVHFSPANFCERYPVTAYTLQVEGSTTFTTEAANDVRVISFDNLMENEMYNVSIVVSNTVGNVSTEKRVIYTTDVQTIIATPIEDTNAFMVKCTFINSSQAMGCRILLLGSLDNTTVDLAKDGTCAEAVVNTSYPVSCYTDVFGYDIESDGSVGTLAIPGLLVMTNTSNGMMCNPPHDQGTPTDPALIVGIVLAILVMMLMMTTSLILIFIKCKRSHRKNRVAECSNLSATMKSDSTSNTDNENKELDEAMPVYDEPHKHVGSIRTAGDGADHSNQYNSTTHTQESPEKADDVKKGATMYAELKEEHVYHVLECESDRPPRGVKVPPPADDILPDEDAPPLPPPFIPDQESQTPPLPPVYQDISTLA